MSRSKNTIRSKAGKAAGVDRPNLPAVLFWEYRYETIDWVNGYRTVIERVLDRGTQEELDEMVRFYGRDKIVDALRNEQIYLWDHGIRRACAFFKLKPEELPCYIKKQSRPRRWF